ncbi:ferritin family protein [Defluviitalea phaphyphila]|uniref:ferritin family protein n=1 Tax=Defluviitalea phaphyphila TaxID=1473580 RepID=UPI000730ED10|nr:ferritin family protein [Defluviitalea phaphyphila]
MGEPKYDAKEILKFAISMEEEGEKFYKKLAEKAKGEIKEGLLSLAEDEVKHKKIFTKWYDDINTDNKEDYLFEETVDLFFKSYAKTKGFDGREEIPNSLEEAIDMGINTEKITIEYYKSLLEHAKSKAKEVLQNLIKEEEGHYNKLKTYKEKIN